MDRLGLTNSIDGDRDKRKASVQPSAKKKSKFDGSCDQSLNIIFKKPPHKDRLNTDSPMGGLQHGSEDDHRLKDMMSSYKSKDYNEAISIGRTILHDYPTNLDALYIVGLSSSMLDRHELTIKYFEQLLLLRPTYKKNVYLFLSIAYKKAGNIDASFNLLNKAIKLFKDFFEAYVGYDLTPDLSRKAQHQNK